jgi:hypothetical protein
MEAAVMTTKTELLRMVREKCIDCCVGQMGEVAQCIAFNCALHPYRMGKDPTPARKQPAHLTANQVWGVRDYDDSMDGDHASALEAAYGPND